MVREKEIRNPMLSIRISPELEERLNRVADMYCVTKGEIARMAIGQYVGQVTGTIDRMMEKVTDSTMKLDIEKILEPMLPKLIEAMLEKDKEGGL